MGHLMLLAEDVITALDRFPSDLHTLILTTYAPQPQWEEYVKGRYTETKKKDRCALGGPKPSPSVTSYGFNVNVDADATGALGGRGDFMGDAGTGEGKPDGMFPGLRLDEAAADAFRNRPKIEIEQGDVEGAGGGERKADVPEDVGTSGGVRGEFRRAGSESASGVRNTADFGPAPVLSRGRDEEDEDDEEKYGNSRTTHVCSFMSFMIKSSC